MLCHMLRVHRTSDLHQVLPCWLLVDNAFQCTV